MSSEVCEGDKACYLNVLLCSGSNPFAFLHSSQGGGQTLGVGRVFVTSVNLTEVTVERLAFFLLSPFFLHI